MFWIQFLTIRRERPYTASLTRILGTNHGKYLDGWRETQRLLREREPQSEAGVLTI